MYVRRLTVIGLMFCLCTVIIRAQDINKLIGSIPPGRSVTITFRALVNNPGITVSNQASVSGVNFSAASTDDPAAGGGSDPTTTTISSNPLPVELVSFRADVNQNSVSLNWSTATEVNNYGFEIERQAEQAGWNKIAFVKGAGNSSSAKEYTYTDRNLNNTKYSYRLKQIDTDGKFSYSKETEAIVNSVPQEYTLLQNYPNPFNPATKIEYTLPYDSHVRLTIYNILGELVSVLADETKTAGYYNIQWNAINAPSGIYFYSLETGSVDGKENFKTFRKMILIK